MKLFKRKVKCINCKYYSKLNMVCNAPYLSDECDECISFDDAFVNRKCDYYENKSVIKLKLHKYDVEYILGQWSKEAKLQSYHSILFSIDSKRKIIYIYTDRPGFLIGKAGYLINKYKNIFKAYKYKVIIKEAFIIDDNN